MNLVHVTSTRVPRERPHSGTSVYMPTGLCPTLGSWSTWLAIRHHHLELGYHDPLVDKPLSYLCRGSPHHQGNHMRVRLPLTSAMFTSSHPALSHSNSEV